MCRIVGCIGHDTNSEMKLRVLAVRKAGIVDMTQQDYFIMDEDGSTQLKRRVGRIQIFVMQWISYSAFAGLGILVGNTDQRRSPHQSQWVVYIEGDFAA